MTTVDATLSLPERLIRFAVVGVTCFLIQLGLVHLLGGVLHLYLADAVAFLASAQVNFAFSQSFTWADRLQAERILLRWLKFNFSALLSVTLVNATVVWLLAQAGTPLWFAVLTANAASTVWTFLMNHFVVFKRRPARQIPTSTGESPCTQSR